MFCVNLDSKGCMSWDDNILAIGQDTLSLHSLHNTTLQQLQSLPLKSQVSCLEWSKTAEGILAGGSSSGVSFWKKSLLLSDPSKSFIKEDKIFDGAAITNLQFCPSKPNLLAVGASEVYILNLDVGLTKQNPSQYVYKLAKNPMEGKTLTSLAWNPQVQYILAAASQNCVATVWDLRNNQTLFNVHDVNYLNKSVCSALSWNPDIPTQFIMAYDDLESPNLQIWDLRKHEQPVKELKTNHKTGITALSWCPYDSSIFASSDRSGFTVLWNFKQGQSFLKIDHSFESTPKAIKWVPKTPGMVAFGGDNGEIELRNIYTPAATTEVKVSHSDDPQENLKPEVVVTPKWLPKKAGVVFGFNSKLASFTQVSNKIHIVDVKHSNSHIKEKVEKAQSLYTQSDLQGLSRHFSEGCDNDMKLQWEIISSKFSGDISNILSLLGFDRNGIERATEKHTGKKRGHHEEAPAGRKESFHDTFSFAELSNLDAEDFFNKAGAKREEIKQQVEIRKSEPEFMHTISETISKNVDWDEGSERLIRENIILGNLESAIDCALMCGRTAEALIIAMQGGPDLYSITRDLVLANSKDKYLSNSFLPLLLGNVSDLMMKIDVEKWKEALSILIINNSKASLVLDFAERLENSSMFSAAQACFVYAGSSDKVFKSWIRQFKHTVAEGGSYQNAVFNLFFKSLLYAESLQFFDSELLESIYYEYLTMLFKEGMQKEGLEMMHHLKTPRYNVPLMVLIEKYVKATHGNSRAPWKVLAINPVKVKTAPKMREVYPDNPIKTPVSGKVPGPPDHFRTMPKISTMPEPKKTAFSEPIKNVFPEHPPEIKRTPFENPKDPFHSKASDTQKVPFSNLREPDPVPKNISKAPLEKQAIPPPPPPAKPKDLKKDIIPPQIPSKAEVREIEPPISRPTENIKEVPMERTIERQDFNKLTKPEQVKPKEVPVHIVPKTFPPPKIPTTLPQRPILNTATSSEGVDLSGIPSHFLQIAQKWESAIRDPSISNNARILKDVESKMQEFFNKLRSGELNDTTMNLVIELTEAFASGDFATVGRTHLELTNKTWNENGNWLTAMKRIIQAKQSSRSK